MKKKKMVGFYDYTVILTYCGMLFAFIGILQSIGHNYWSAILCLMMAGVCDMFDGAVASTKERDAYERHFGIQIDSLCDLISFGVLPALFVYRISGEVSWVGIVCCTYLLCGLIRLAYYNVQEFARQQVSEGKRETFVGVPITTSAVLLPLIYLLYAKVDSVGALIFPIVTFMLGIGFVSGIEVKKPNKVMKIIMIIVGILEIWGVVSLSGAKLL